MGKWSKLPLDLLIAIEDNVVLYIDEVRIRAVSFEWNFYLPKLPNHRVNQIPWLLHPLDNDDTEASHGLFSPVDNKVYNIYLPEAREKLFKGSSYGWIVTVEDIHSTTRTDISLINSVTRSQIKLPPRTEFADVVRYSPDEIGQEFVVRIFHDVHDDDPYVDEEFVDEISNNWYDLSLYFTDKVVLSSAPCNDECVVVAIYGQSSQLAWCRCNDTKWTHIYTGLSGFIDVLFSKSYLYALNDEGQVFMFENIGTDVDIKVTEIVAARVPIPRCKSAYLAECSDGNLIVVCRQFYYDTSSGRHLFHTMGFKVYKLGPDSNSNWVEVNNIGDDVLFVGFGSVTSILSRDLPGYKRNHIYFSNSSRACATFEENKNSKPDVGIFNLEDATVELLPMPGSEECIWPRPIWINFG